MSKSHQLLAFFVTLIWGTNFVFIKYGLDELPPFLFAAIRFFLVAFHLVFFMKRPKAGWGLIAAYGLLIGFGQFGVLFYAMQNDISPGLASLVVQTQIFFSIIFAIFMFKETIKPAQWIALLISFSGIALIGSKVDDNTTLLGLVLVLIAAMSWAMGNMVIKKAGKVDIIAFLAYSSLFTVPVLFAMSLYFEGWTLMKSSIQSASMTSVYVVLWQTIGNTLIGYGIWNYLISRYNASVVTPWALLVPVSGMMASYLMLGEPMPIWKIIAALLILTGLALNIYMSVRTVRKARVSKVA
jgi:O-acetylserine/cysteine efflux transporter